MDDEPVLARVPGASSSAPITPTGRRPAGSFAAGLAAYDRLAAAPPARVVVCADTPMLVSLLTALMRRMGWRRPPPRVR